MKICLITDTYNPNYDGGAGIYVETIAREMVKAGHYVSIISTKSFDGLKSLCFQEEKKSSHFSIFRFYPLNLYHKGNYAQHGLFVKPLWYMLDIWNPHVFLVYYRLAQRKKWDIVHTHNLGSLSSSILLAIKKNKIPWIHTIHDCSLICPRSTLYRSSNQICLYPPFPCKVFRWAKKIFWLHPDIILSPSNFVLDIFNQNGFLKKSKHYALPLGVPINVNNIRSYSKYRKKKINSENGLKLLFLGRVAEFKGVRWILKILHERSIPEIELHIAGTGPQESLLRDRYMSSKVIFYGYLQDFEKDDLMKKCDILIVPSLCYDNSPIVIYEAFSYGMPVLGSHIGGIPELVRNGETGFTFEPGNDSQFISALKKLLTDRRLLAIMSQRCLRYSTQLSIQSHVEKLTGYYQNCINSSERTRVEKPTE